MDVENKVKDILASKGALFYSKVKENMWRMKALDYLKMTQLQGKQKSAFSG